MSATDSSDRSQEDPFKDSAFEDVGDPALETPDGGDLPAHMSEKGVVPLGYQGLGKGSTPAEEEAGDTLDERLERELPDGPVIGHETRRHVGPDADLLGATDEPSAEEAAMDE